MSIVWRERERERGAPGVEGVREYCGDEKNGVSGRTLEDRQTNTQTHKQTNKTHTHTQRERERVGE